MKTSFKNLFKHKKTGTRTEELKDDDLQTRLDENETTNDNDENEMNNNNLPNSFSHNIFIALMTYHSFFFLEKESTHCPNQIQCMHRILAIFKNRKNINSSKKYNIKHYKGRLQN